MVSSSKFARTWKDLLIDIDATVESLELDPQKEDGALCLLIPNQSQNRQLLAKTIT